MLRRRTDNAPPVADSVTAAPESRQAGKGRPTPKRSDAERKRRQPYTPPPSDRKGAALQDRERRRAERVRKMEAMRRGEEWALPAKDRGQLKGLARDYVDARRTMGEYYMLGFLALIILLLAFGLSNKTSVAQTSLPTYIALAFALLLFGEAWYHGTRVIRLANQRFPGQSTRGLRLYTALRVMQYRKMRMPPPRVNRGDRI